MLTSLEMQILLLKSNNYFKTKMVSSPSSVHLYNLVSERKYFNICKVILLGIHEVISLAYRLWYIKEKALYVECITVMHISKK